MILSQIWFGAKLNKLRWDCGRTLRLIFLIWWDTRILIDKRSALILYRWCFVMFGRGINGPAVFDGDLLESWKSRLRISWKKVFLAFKFGFNHEKKVGFEFSRKKQENSNYSYNKIYSLWGLIYWSLFLLLYFFLLIFHLIN